MISCCKRLTLTYQINHLWRHKPYSCWAAILTILTLNQRCRLARRSAPLGYGASKTGARCNTPSHWPERSTLEACWKRGGGFRQAGAGRGPSSGGGTSAGPGQEGGIGADSAAGRILEPEATTLGVDPGSPGGALRRNPPRDYKWRQESPLEAIGGLARGRGAAGARQRSGGRAAEERRARGRGAAGARQRSGGRAAEVQREVQGKHGSGGSVCKRSIGGGRAVASGRTSGGSCSVLSPWHFL
jgi:hypothetical protein